MDMQNSTLITLSWELYEQGIPKIRIGRRLGKHRETIHLWIKGIQRYGLLGFLEKYEQAKKGERRSRRVDPIVKRLVWGLREREFQCCGQKIQYFLELEHGIHLSVPKIYEILAEKYVIRSRWRKNRERGPIPEPSIAREVVQMDSMDFGDIYAFTAIDTFTREADILLAPELTAKYGVRFLIQSMRRRFGGHVHLIQTDGGPEFKADFLANVPLFCHRHRVARPYRKNEQSYIESFNRTVRKECLGWQKYPVRDLNECKEMVESFLQRYHYHRPHLGLGMRPPLLQNNPKEADCRIFTENRARG
jgi:transposase InsO family protein